MRTRVPETQTETSSPVGEDKEEVFPRCRKGTCRGEAGSLAWTGQAALPRWGGKALSRRLGPAHEEANTRIWARASPSRTVIRPHVLREQREKSLRDCQRSQFPRTPVFPRPPGPGGPLRARQSAAGALLRAPPAGRGVAARPSARASRRCRLTGIRKPPRALLAPCSAGVPRPPGSSLLNDLCPKARTRNDSKRR